MRKEIKEGKSKMTPQTGNPNKPSIHMSEHKVYWITKKISNMEPNIASIYWWGQNVNVWIYAICCIALIYLVYYKKGAKHGHHVRLPPAQIAETPM